MKKVKIYTIADKTPFFIKWQYNSFKKHLKDDFELIILNNSSNEFLNQQNIQECNNINLNLIDVQQRDFSTGSFANARPIQYAIDEYISKDRNCISVAMDSDIFLMKDFSFNEYLGDYHIAGLPQAKHTGTKIIEYIWIGFIVINNDTAPNLKSLDIGCGMIWHAPIDSGGLSYFYLTGNPDLKWRRTIHSGIEPENLPEIISLFPESIRTEYPPELSFEVIEYCFLHYRGGSNWDNKSPEYHEIKRKFLRKLLDAS